MQLGVVDRSDEDPAARSLASNMQLGVVGRSEADARRLAELMKSQVNNTVPRC